MICVQSIRKNILKRSITLHVKFPGCVCQEIYYIATTSQQFSRVKREKRTQVVSHCHCQQGRIKDPRGPGANLKRGAPHT